MGDLYSTVVSATEEGKVWRKKRGEPTPDHGGDCLHNAAPSRVEDPDRAELVAELELDGSTMPASHAAAIRRPDDVRRARPHPAEAIFRFQPRS